MDTRDEIGQEVGEGVGRLTEAVDGCQGAGGLAGDAALDALGQRGELCGGELEERE